MSHELDVSVAGSFLEDNTPALSLKLSGPVVEVNVWFALDEARALRRVLTLGEGDRGLRLGVSANSPVHWARGENGMTFLLIGDDDETWDVGITLPGATFLEIVKEIEECLQAGLSGGESDP